MTDREAIEHIIAWHRLEIDEMDPKAMNQVLALAESALAYQPAPGSVEVRVAVGVVSDTASKLNAVLRNVREDGSDNSAMAYVLIPQVTHAAIVTAWIPPVSTPQVKGTVQG